MPSKNEIEKTDPKDKLEVFSSGKFIPLSGFSGNVTFTTKDSRNFNVLNIIMISNGIIQDWTQK